MCEECSKDHECLSGQCAHGSCFSRNGTAPGGCRCSLGEDCDSGSCNVDGGCQSRYSVLRDLLEHVSGSAFFYKLHPC